MNTFKLIMAMALFSLFVKEGVGQSGFQVKGMVQGLHSDSVTILHFNTPFSPNIEKIPSRNGEFQFSGCTKHPYFVQILYSDKEGANRKLTEFMLENSDIQIKGDSLHFDSIQVEGSISNIILQSYLKEDKELLNQWDDLKMSYDQAVQTRNQKTAEKIGKKLNHIFLDERKILLKNYVKTNRDHMVAALLPNFCLLADQLTSEDYSDLYASLSIPIQESIYGKELLLKSELK